MLFCLPEGDALFNPLNTMFIQMACILVFSQFFYLFLKPCGQAGPVAQILVSFLLLFLYFIDSKHYDTETPTWDIQKLTFLLLYSGWDCIEFAHNNPKGPRFLPPKRLSKLLHLFLISFTNMFHVLDRSRTWSWLYETKLEELHCHNLRLLSLLCHHLDPFPLVPRSFSTYQRGHLNVVRSLPGYLIEHGISCGHPLNHWLETPHIWDRKASDILRIVHRDDQHFHLHYGHCLHLRENDRRHLCLHICHGCYNFHQ